MVTAPQTAPPATQDDPSQPVVVFDRVSIGFEGKQVLENISLTVSPGETRILLGPRVAARVCCSNSRMD